LLAVSGGEESMAEWLFDNKDAVLDAFDSATIRQVSPKLRAKVAKALAEVIAESGNALLAKHEEDLASTWKLANQKRVSEEDKPAVIRAALAMVAGGDEDVADWIFANQEAIEEALNPKRPINSGLRYQHAKKAEEKADAMEAEGAKKADVKAQRAKAAKYLAEAKELEKAEKAAKKAAKK